MLLTQSTIKNHINVCLYLVVEFGIVGAKPSIYCPYLIATFCEPGDSHVTAAYPKQALH